MMYDFHYGLILLDQMYGVQIDDLTYEEMGLIAYHSIGNRRSHLVDRAFKVDCKTNSVDLPCDAENLISVSVDGGDYTPMVDNTSASVDSLNIRSSRHNTSNTTIGRYIDYRIEGRKLIVNKGISEVVLKYTTEILDENELPLITETEAKAIATYVAYILKQKEGLKTGNGNILQIAKMLQQDWERYCAQARVVFAGGQSKMSQNAMNEYMDLATSWDRKVYGKSYKFRP